MKLTPHRSKGGRRSHHSKGFSGLSPPEATSPATWPEEGAAGRGLIRLGSSPLTSHQPVGPAQLAPEENDTPTVLTSEESQLLCLPALPSSQWQHRSEGSTEVKEAAAERRQLSQKRKHLKLTPHRSKGGRRSHHRKGLRGLCPPEATCICQATWPHTNW